jgi:hypothetical protein
VKSQIIYQNGSITITKKQAFGKIGLSGHNSKTGATTTALLTDESQVQNKIINMINELKKESVRIDLTPRIEKIERVAISSLS